MSDPAAENTATLALLAVCWILYFTVHSALASLGAKKRVAERFPAWVRGYRLFFNAQAVLLLLPITWITLRYPGPPLWAWRGMWTWLSNGLALAALAGFAFSLMHYDLQEFLGLKQWKARTAIAEESESLRLSLLHRHVRHPWYFFGLVLIWTRDMNAALLLSSVMMTIYIVVGSRLENAKLIAAYGDAYRRYMKRVPGLIPLPGKSITAEEADELVRSAERASRRLSNPE